MIVTIAWPFKALKFWYIFKCHYLVIVGDSFPFFFVVPRGMSQFQEAYVMFHLTPSQVQLISNSRWDLNEASEFNIEVATGIKFDDSKMFVSIKIQYLSYQKCWDKFTDLGGMLIWWGCICHFLNFDLKITLSKFQVNTL